MKNNSQISKRVLLILPPQLNINFVYPSTAYLTHFLSSRGAKVDQFDVGAELVHRLLSAKGLGRIRTEVLKQKETCDLPHDTIAQIDSFIGMYDEIVPAVESAVAFLRSPKARGPESPEAFRKYIKAPPTQDYLTRKNSVAVLGKIVELINKVIDPRFRLRSFSPTERLGDYEVVQKNLEGPSTLVTEMIDEIASEVCLKLKPDLVGVSVPFLECVLGAFFVARKAKEVLPQVHTVMGGGYVSTVLRKISNPDVFDLMDFITLDDGEVPIWAILENLEGLRAKENLVRTWVRDAGVPKYIDNGKPAVIAHKEDGIGMPKYQGLDRSKYLATYLGVGAFDKMLGGLNWNRMTLAHGCYWKQCAFCDVHFDYVARFEPAGADLLIDRIETIIAETGLRGFHFVDEAAPPALLKTFAQRLIERKVEISWYTNVRFDKFYTPDVCDLLYQAGCIGVLGGIEVADERILKLMKKGVSLTQAIEVTSAFSSSGIFVYSYLMHGFPTQSLQETIDALEFIRQMFLNGCLFSGNFSLFMVTAGSPVKMNPEKFGVRLTREKDFDFANGIWSHVEIQDPGFVHADYTTGLNRAIAAFAAGKGMERPLQEWFPGLRVPATRLDPNFVLDHLQKIGRVSKIKKRA